MSETTFDNEYTARAIKAVQEQALDSYRTALKKKIEERMAYVVRFPFTKTFPNSVNDRINELKHFLELIDSTTI